MAVIDKTKLPEHIAIILDGNGRWAKAQNKPRMFGHEKGAENLGRIAQECNEMGIKCLTVYAFSTENWKRPKEEVNFIMTKPISAFKKHKKKIKDSDIKVKFLGRKSKFSQELLEVMNEIEEATANNKGMTLAICADYGSRYELIEGIKDISTKVKNDEISIDEINEQLIDQSLFTKDLPELDLLIRTSGEKRISNFLLWQLSYSELYFTDVHFPAFDKEELHKAIVDYQSRNRRFGKSE